MSIGIVGNFTRG